VEQDLALQLLQLGSGLDPQLLAPAASRVLVGAQRLGLAAGAVERQHEQAPSPLPVGVVGDECLEFAHHLGVIAGSERRFDPILRRNQPALLQLHEVWPQGRLIGEIGQRRAAPHRQGLVEFGNCGARIIRYQAVTGRRPMLEAIGIELILRDVEHVPWSPRLDGGTPQLLAEAGDVGLERPAGRCRWIITPDRVDEPIRRHHLVGVGHQGGENHALAPTPQRYRTIAVQDLQRAQDADVHAVMIAIAVGGT
jgi:hypothetical protein